jgi:hypothetical protein
MTCRIRQVKRHVHRRHISKEETEEEVWRGGGATGSWLRAGRLSSIIAILQGESLTRKRTLVRRSRSWEAQRA